MIVSRKDYRRGQIFDGLEASPAMSTPIRRAY